MTAWPGASDVDPGAPAHEPRLRANPERAGDPRREVPSTDAGFVLRRVEVEGRVVDVHLAGGLVRAVGERLVAPGLDELNGRGGALLPGLHDHHVHLLAMAARLSGVDLDPLPDAHAVDAALRSRVHHAPAHSGPEAVRRTVAGAIIQRTVSGVMGKGDAERGSGASMSGSWVRAAGYDEHRHGPMDRYRLDALAPGVAVRVQHRSGLSWVLSTEAMRAVGLLGAADGPGGARVDPEPAAGVELGADGEPTGWLHRLDGWLRHRVPSGLTGSADLGRVGERLARFGLTGVTDATFALGPQRLAVLREASRSGAFPQRLMLLGIDDAADVAGWATRGPLKLLADELLGLECDTLAEQIAGAHAAGRAVAIHAVTRAENVVAVTALTAAGVRSGDRIEHGSVLPADLDPLLAAGGITVVVQPSLVAERGDHHLIAVETEDLPFLHRHASLLAAGVRVGVGSDAPVTSADPWAGIAAAARRTTRAGEAVGPDEAVPPRVALGWYLADPLDPGGPPRRIRPGAPADLCLLDGPLGEVLAEPDADRVRATWVAGRLMFR